jgi:hypothetical protein
VTPREVVLAWADALNGRDLDGMLALVTEDFQLERFVDDGDRLVAGGTGQWRRVETAGSRAPASRRSRSGSGDRPIARAKLHPSLEAALHSNG